MDSETYLSDENWRGSYYELGMEFAPSGEDERLLRALTALWESPMLHGPWRERRDFGQAPILPSLPEVGDVQFLYGEMQLFTGRSIGCLSTIIRNQQGTDSLDFCIPTGMPDLAFPVRYPLTRVENSWADGIDAKLLTLANRVYQASPFDLAVLGEEASALRGIESLTTEDLAKGGVLVPPLADELGPEAGLGIARPSGLRWSP